MMSSFTQNSQQHKVILLPSIHRSVDEVIFLPSIHSSLDAVIFLPSIHSSVDDVNCVSVLQYIL